MRGIKQVLLLVAASAAVSSAGRAQETRPDPESCRDTAVAGMYRRCALWIDGNKVRLGDAGVVVARPMFIIPARLTSVVAGDSAMAYANLFERQSKQSTALYLASAVLLGISIANAECGGDYNGCAYDWGFDSPGFSLLVGSVVLGGLGGHFRGRAKRSGAKAVWWHNARFAR